METKIEAAYVRDEKFAKEYFSYHSYKRPLGIIITVICILLIVSGIINVFAYKDYLAITAIVLGIYLFVLRVVRVKKSIKISLERDKESNHGNFVSVQNFVTENSIIVKSSTNESGTEFEMSCIKKAYRSKNYIYLITKAKWAIVFDINKFSKGTPDELVEFVRQKGIKIK
ncbi:MAG: hypothetical protein IJW79_06340 [Clostridia bacterium]|nr:hypothetical protein [Clostridia bacterium]